MQAKIDSFKQYLDPEMCFDKSTGSQNSKPSTHITSLTYGPTTPSKSLAVKPTKSSEHLSAHSPKMRLINSSNTTLDAEIPKTDVRAFPGLSDAERDELEQLYDRVDSSQVNEVTVAEETRFRELLLKAYADSPTNTALPRDIVATWRDYRLSEAYESTAITFDKYQGFKEWWEAVIYWSQNQMPHQRSLTEEQASVEPQMIAGGKMITPGLQHRIKQEHKNDHYSLVTDNPCDPEEQMCLGLSGTATGGKAVSEGSPNRRKRNHLTAFSTGTRRAPTVTTTYNDSNRKVEHSEELWKKIMTDMRDLAKIYLDFARTSVNNVVRSEIGLETLDMAGLIKPTSFPGCLQQLMTVFTAEALDQCFEDAFETLDYDIADKISMASRALGAHVHNVHHAGDDSTSPNEAQKRAGRRYLDEAKRYLSILEQMTKGDAIAENIKAQWSLDTQTRLVQLMQFVIANEGRSPVDAAMQYMKAAQAGRAEKQLENFLEKVKRMTKELISDFDRLKELQKYKQKDASKCKHQQRQQNRTGQKDK